MLQRKVTWSNIMQTDFHCIQFLVQAVYDALTSPANVHVWGKSGTHSCPLCSGRAGATTRCSKQLLQPSAPTTTIMLRRQSPSSRLERNLRHGHRQQQASSTQPPIGSCRLTRLTWELQIDLEKQLRFPQHIASTSLRPDMIITSEASKHLIMLELTVHFAFYIKNIRI